MFYLMKGKIEWGGSFAWVVEAESEEEAKAQLDEGDILEEIREIPVEERIKREEDALFNAIKRDYLLRRYGERNLRGFKTYQKGMEDDPEMYYRALNEFNTLRRFVKIFSKRKEFENMTVSKFFDTITKLLDFKSEEELKTLLEGIGN